MTRRYGSVVYHKANVCWGLGGGELGSKLPVLCYASMPAILSNTIITL